MPVFVRFPNGVPEGRMVTCSYTPQGGKRRSITVPSTFVVYPRHLREGGVGQHQVTFCEGGRLCITRENLDGEILVEFTVYREGDRIPELLLFNVPATRLVGKREETINMLKLLTEIDEPTDPGAYTTAWQFAVRGVVAPPPEEDTEED